MPPCIDNDLMTAGRPSLRELLGTRLEPAVVGWDAACTEDRDFHDDNIYSKN
jgi:hypothetical protein